MSKTNVVTSRLPDEILADVDRLAKELDRSRAWIVAKAIERYVGEELEFIAFIKEGEADLDAGRVRSQDEVETLFGIGSGERDAA
jgi:predicted transcriptional regulator